jgi:hypothetical protein
MMPTDTQRGGHATIQERGALSLSCRRLSSRRCPAVACLPRRSNIRSEATNTVDNPDKGITLAMRLDGESRFGDRQNPKGLPSDPPRRTVSRSDAKGNHSWRA